MLSIYVLLATFFLFYAVYFIVKRAVSNAAVHKSNQLDVWTESYVYILCLEYVLDFSRDKIHIKDKSLFSQCQDFYKTYQHIMLEMMWVSRVQVNKIVLAI